MTQHRSRRKVVLTDGFRQPYVERLVELYQRSHPCTEFRPLRVREMMQGHPPTVVHIQWIDPVFRRPGLPEVGLHAMRLVGIVAMARIRGARLVWTAHNLIGKGHRFRYLDRLLRSILAVAVHRVVVLNETAGPLVVGELLGPVRPIARRKVALVPHPLLRRDHGQPVARDRARACLGIETNMPLVSYMPGANQSDRGVEIGDLSRRYQVLRVDRNSSHSGISASPDGWTYHGRPSDLDYGLILCATDAIVLTDERALGSATIHTAAQYRRPVITPRCPAASELARAGGAVELAGSVSADAIAGALRVLLRRPPSSLDHAFETFEAAHADPIVEQALDAVYSPQR